MACSSSVSDEEEVLFQIHGEVITQIHLVVSCFLLQWHKVFMGLDL